MAPFTSGPLQFHLELLASCGPRDDELSFRPEETRMEGLYGTIALQTWIFHLNFEWQSLTV